MRRNSDGKEPVMQKQDRIKSPSDTTLYTPVLKQSKKMDNMIDKISNFVESVRLENNGRNSSTPVLQRGRE